MSGDSFIVDTKSDLLRTTYKFDQSWSNQPSVGSGVNENSQALEV